MTKRVWSAPQRPFRVCCHNRETKKGITAGTLEELKERVSVLKKTSKSSETHIEKKVNQQCVIKWTER